MTDEGCDCAAKKSGDVAAGDDLSDIFTEGASAAAKWDSDTSCYNNPQGYGSQSISRVG